MAQEQEQNGLLDFNWEGDNTEFFGVPGPAPAKQPSKAKPDPEDEDEDPTPPAPNKDKQEPEEEEEDDDFFDDEDDTKKQKPSGDNKGGDDNPGDIYTGVTKELKEFGIFKHVEIDEDEEIDPDRFAELVEEEYEAEVSERLKNWATQDLDEDARAFIKFKRDGGRTEDFFKTYSQGTSVIPEGDIEDEDYQDSVIRYQLSQEGWDKDEIEDRIAYLTDNGRKDKVAKKYDEKIKEDRDKQKKAILKQQEEAKRAAKQQEEEFRETLKEALDETDEISGFKFSSQDKQAVLKFLTKKEHKVSDTKSVTGFQKKLAEVFQDPEKMILLAKMVQSDFDFSGFEKATVTKKTRQVKTNLEQRKNLRPSGSGSSSQGKSLADLWD